jgi:hypothetical protein
MKERKSNGELPIPSDGLIKDGFDFGSTPCLKCGGTFDPAPGSEFGRSMCVDCLYLSRCLAKRKPRRRQ